MKRFKLSLRLNKLPPYLFAEIDNQKQRLRQQGKALIDLSIGDPDILAPRGMLKVLCRSARLKENQRYALDRGKYSLRGAIKRWFRKRFGVLLSEEREILPLIGSKEGLVHFPLAFVNPQDYIILPSPAYPGYQGAAILAGARIYHLSLKEENNFLPDLERIPLRIRNKAKIIYLNYPNNPTTVLAPRDFLKRVVSFCAKYGIIVAYDNAYSEIYFGRKPLSILEIKGAKEIACEFHSFSKTFSMTGFRIGWACGNKKLIDGLLKVKTNVDSGVFSALQDAAAYSLDKEEQYVANLRRTIKRRRDIFLEGIKKLGFEKIWAESTFYVWSKLPSKFHSSLSFCQLLLRKGVVSTPGIGFGSNSDRFVRFALTVDFRQLKQATALMGRI